MVGPEIDTRAFTSGVLTSLSTTTRPRISLVTFRGGGSARRGLSRGGLEGRGDAWRPGVCARSVAAAASTRTGRRDLRSRILDPGTIGSSEQFEWSAARSVRAGLRIDGEPFTRLDARSRQAVPALER